MSCHYPRRAIHFDFHTMPGCTDIGAKFDGPAFAATLKQAGVEFINFFAKCNVGFCYFPTKVGTMYPGLTRDLLGEVIASCHAVGIKVSAYFNVGLSHEEALRHREWCIVNPKGQVYEFDVMNHWFRKMCFNSGYRGHILALIREVLENYPVDGLIFDSMNPPPCHGIECVEQMEQLGLDINRPEDAAAFAQQTKLSLKQDIEALAGRYRQDLFLYFLGVEACYQPTHIELEVLPQGGWGYDYLPSRIRYIRTLGKPYATMTGRFQRSWGDLGGLRPEPALFYDCINSVANGGACSIGDHLHPAGALQPPVYDMISRVYARLAALDEWTDGAQSQADMAIFAPWLDEAIPAPPAATAILAGASRLLLELGCQYDVLDGAADLRGYRLLFLPDEVRLTPALADKVQAFLDQGGAVISSAWSGLTPDGAGFALPAYREAIEMAGPELGDPTFFHAGPEVADGVPAMGVTIYSPGIAMRPRADRGISGAGLGRSYWKIGQWDHKHEYLYAPEKELTDDSALVRTADGKVWHFAFPIAADYYQYATTIMKRVLGNIIRQVLPEPLVTVKNLPSYGVATVTDQPARHRRLLHLLCFVPEKRGRAMEIIEEPSVAVNLDISLRLDGRTARRVYLAPDRKDLAFTQSGDRVCLRLDVLVGQALIVIEA